VGDYLRRSPVSTLAGFQRGDKRRARLESLDLFPASRNHSTLVGVGWALHQT
jgi:hypothetical protein